MLNKKMFMMAGMIMTVMMMGVVVVGGGVFMQGKLATETGEGKMLDLEVGRAISQIATQTLVPGKLNVEIAKLRLSPSDEALTVDWFAFLASGKNGVSAFKNWRLVREDNSVITQNVGYEGDYIYFKGPFQLDANSGIIVKILADVSSGTKAGNYSLYYHDIIGTYLNKSGAFVSPVYNDLHGSLITVVSKGTATLAKDPASPSGSVDLGSKNVVLGKFTVTAKDEDVQLKKIALDFSMGVDRRTNGSSNTTGYFDCVTINVHDTSCASRTDVIDSIMVLGGDGALLYTSPAGRLDLWNSLPSYVNLTYSPTIKAGSTENIRIVGTLNSSSMDTGSGEYLTVGINKIQYYTTETKKYANTSAAFGNPLYVK